MVIEMPSRQVRLRVLQVPIIWNTGKLCDGRLLNGRSVRRQLFLQEYYVSLWLLLLEGRHQVRREPK